MADKSFLNQTLPLTSQKSLGKKSPHAFIKRINFKQTSVDVKIMAENHHITRVKCPSKVSITKPT
jgi:hypothetical protein